MITDERLNATMEAIGEADTVQLAGIIEQALIAHGHFGREVTANMLASIKAADRENDPYLREALVQLSDLEGVLDGRLEAL